MDRVHYERDGRVVTLTLDDGKANVLGPPMVAELEQALTRAEADDGVRALVLAGRAGRFCAGFDLKAIAKGRAIAEPLVKAGAELFLRVYGFPMPVVAACTGHALAGGALLLLSCDARVGAEGEFKVGLNEVAIGIELPVLVRRLASDRLDRRRLVEATLLATVYDPPGAVAAGFLDEVVPAEEVIERAHATARTLAMLPRGPLARSKAAMRAEALEQIRGSFDDDMARNLSGGGAG